MTDRRNFSFFFLFKGENKGRSREKETFRVRLDAGVRSKNEKMASRRRGDENQTLKNERLQRSWLTDLWRGAEG